MRRPAAPPTVVVFTTWTCTSELARGSKTVSVPDAAVVVVESSTEASVLGVVSGFVWWSPPSQWWLWLSLEQWPGGQVGELT